MGPLQKEELQLGVDAANRAAQQYQQSKISRNYCSKVTMDVIKKMRQHSIWIYYEWSLNVL